MGERREGETFCESLTVVAVPHTLKSALRVVESFLVYVDVDEDGNLIRAIAGVGVGRHHVLGIDNLRAMIGEPGFQELRKLASEVPP